ncbi:MAG: SGNH/GDSL hydrolase family protein [Gemmataceae bacterium]|nr:SGNH/GDSL hydrolase family protein [Gemmataceae bacterium]
MILLPAAVAAVSLVAADPPPTFALKDGDRIVWIGNTLVEREQRYGYWETALHAAYPKVNFTLRNLGWSGDTVTGDARAGFDTPEKGYERLVSLTLELKPTVIFVSYGQNESFDGEAGTARFEKGLNRLLDALKPAKARVVLFTPVPVYKREFTAGPAAADGRNAAIRRYSEVIWSVAAGRGLPCLDLGDAVARRLTSRDIMDGTRQKPPAGEEVTENGLHLNAAGYRTTAPAFLTYFDHDPAAGSEWATLEPLRQAVVAKNELFFHRWRPQNETYLFGFRKHEQGKNAKEVAEFDPLVKIAEDEIDRIKKTLAK